jgi:hypothetical protein
MRSEVLPARRTAVSAELPPNPRPPERPKVPRVHTQKHYGYGYGYYSRNPSPPLYPFGGVNECDPRRISGNSFRGRHVERALPCERALLRLHGCSGCAHLRQCAAPLHEYACRARRRHRVRIGVHLTGRIAFQASAGRRHNGEPLLTCVATRAAPARRPWRCVRHRQVRRWCVVHGRDEA